MTLDKNKRPIICQHEEIETVEAKGYAARCTECGLRFRVRPPKKRKFSRERRK